MGRGKGEILIGSEELAGDVDRDVGVIEKPDGRKWSCAGLRRLKQGTKRQA